MGRACLYAPGVCTDAPWSGRTWSRSLGPADLFQEDMGLGLGSLSGRLRSPAPLQAGLGLEPDFREMGGSLRPHTP